MCWFVKEKQPQVNFEELFSLNRHTHMVSTKLEPLPVMGYTRRAGQADRRGGQWGGRRTSQIWSDVYHSTEPSVTKTS